MTSKGSKSQAGQGRVSTASHKLMFDHFKGLMGTISLDVADLSMDLQALRESLSQWEAAFDAAAALLERRNKKRPRFVSKRTSSRQPASRS